MKVIIPPNTSARVYILNEEENSVIENGKSALNAEGIKFLKMEGNYATLEVVSGNYHFINKYIK